MHAPHPPLRVVSDDPVIEAIRRLTDKVEALADKASAAERNEERLKSLEKLVRGNGNDGLATRVALLEKGEGDAVELQGIRWRVIGQIIVATAAIVSLAMQLLL